MDNISSIVTQSNPRTLTILSPKTNIPIDIVFEYITPGMAKSFLKDNIKNNRKPNKRFVSGYARAMKDGLWECTNGESIKFNQDGKLVDGQHRLLGIIEANISVHMMVIYGVTNSAINTLDDGNKRKLRDVLTIRGEKIKGRLTSIEGAIKNLFLLRDTFNLDQQFQSIRAQHVPTAELIEFLGRMKDFKTVCEVFHDKYTYGEAEQVIPLGTLIPMYYLFHDINPIEVDLLVRTFQDKIPASGDGKQCPSWHIIRKISLAKENQQPIRAHDYMNMFIWAMNEMVNKNTHNKLNYTLTWQFKKDFKGRLKAKQKLQKL